MSAITVGIIDDEPLARQKIRLMIEAAPDFAVVGEAGDGEGAVRLIAGARPQLICLDIRLPGLSGLDVLRLARPRPEVIFTTAFGQHAVTAFELAALDYVLKPFSRERFQLALTRARARLASRESPAPGVRLRDVTEPVYLTRLFVRDRGTIRPLRVSAVHYFESNDDYTSIVVGSDRHDLNIPLGACEARLDPATFKRIHRRFIVNLDHVTAIRGIEGSRFEVHLRNGAVLESSRSRSRALRNWSA